MWEHSEPQAISKCWHRRKTRPLRAFESSAWPELFLTSKGRTSCTHGWVACGGQGRAGGALTSRGGGPCPACSSPGPLITWPF